MNPIVTMSKGALGIKPYPVLVVGCIVDAKNEVMQFDLYDDFRKDPKTEQYTLNKKAHFTFNPFAVQINKELQAELDKVGFTMPVDTVPERKPDEVVRRGTKENGKMESECPAFMSNWDPEVIECKECAKAFQDEYAACKRATLIEQAKKEVVEAAPTQSTPAPVEPVASKADKTFKGFRAGSRAQVLLEYLKEKKECSLVEAADYIALKFKIDKKFSLEGIKAYLGEWVKGKWGGQDQNFKFTVVIQNGMISYQDK